VWLDAGIGRYSPPTADKHQRRTCLSRPRGVFPVLEVSLQMENNSLLRAGVEVPAHVGIISGSLREVEAVGHHTIVAAQRRA